MKNIFENAYFGKPYKTRDGRKALFVKKDKNWFKKSNICAIEDISSLYNYSDEGDCKSVCHCGFDIVSEWEEPINEEELDKKSHNYKVGYNDGLADGYRKAKGEII